MNPVLQLTDISLRQLVRSKTLIGIGLVVAFAVGITALIAAYENNSSDAEHYQTLQFVLLSTTVVPLVALLLGTGAMASERESGTLAYLFSRPIARSAVVVGKGFGAVLVANAVVLVTVLLVFVVSGAPGNTGLQGGIAALLLETTALTSLFLLFGTLVAKSLYLGLAYVALFEGLLGNTLGASTGWSVTYHARNLLTEWSGNALPSGLRDALPGSAGGSVVVLVLVAAGALVAAAAWVETREYGLRDRSKEE